MGWTALDEYDKPERILRDGLTFSAQKMYADPATAWPERQSARLGVTCETILDAIAHWGHTPIEIEKYENAHPLGYAPSGAVAFKVIEECRPILKR